MSELRKELQEKDQFLPIATLMSAADDMLIMMECIEQSLRSQ